MHTDREGADPNERGADRAALKPRHCRHSTAAPFSRALLPAQPPITAPRVLFCVGKFYTASHLENIPQPKGLFYFYNLTWHDNC